MYIPSALLATGSFQGTLDKTTEGFLSVSVMSERALEGQNCENVRMSKAVWWSQHFKVL